MTPTLTSYQRDNQELVRLWLQNPEDRRARRLRPQDILLTYQPRAIAHLGQFFTPLEAAAAVAVSDFNLLRPCR